MKLKIEKNVTLSNRGLGKITFPVVIKGKCHGIGLRERSTNKLDKHVCFQILSEDDGHWWYEENFSSSHWLLEMIELLEEAHQYLRKHCEMDICSQNGKNVQFGWSFR